MPSNNPFTDIKKEGSPTVVVVMAEQQRIHPVDVEAGHGQTAPPTAPLMPRGSNYSDKGDPSSTTPFSSQRRTIPVHHSKPPKRRGCCCRCISWTLCLIIAFIVALAITAGALYLIFRPKLPDYSVDRLRISSFNVDTNSIITAGFAVTITAKNPNDKIGIYYVDGSDISVWYSDINLCKGTLPVFYQGHHNTTALNVVLTGQTQVGNTLVSELGKAQQTGFVPLDMKATVPVRVKFGALKLWKVKFLVRCHVVVNSLNANLDISIRSSSCDFKFRM